MKITIKSIGFKAGTVGWLKSGLENGSLEISEGTLKGNGNHALFLKGENLSQFLAGFDPLNISDRDPAYARYQRADDLEDRLGLWTNAAWETLMTIAQNWCETLEEIRESEQPVEIKIARIISHV